MYFVQGIIKALLPAFPLIEVISAEGAICGFYFGVRTFQNVKQATLDNKAIVAEAKNPCPPEEQTP
jgi:hypothetical protein